MEISLLIFYEKRQPLNISDATITHICVLLPFWGGEYLHEKKFPTKIALHTSNS